MPTSVEIFYYNTTNFSTVIFLISEFDTRYFKNIEKLNNQQKLSNMKCYDFQSTIELINNLLSDLRYYVNISTIH